MTVHPVPNQVSVECDTCGESLGNEEFGGVYHFDGDDPVERDQQIRDFEWRINDDGTHTCESCVDEETAGG